MYSFYLEHSEETMPYEYRWGEGVFTYMSDKFECMNELMNGWMDVGK